MQQITSDPPARRNPTFLVMTAFGLCGLLVLLVGAGLFAYYEPLSQNSGDYVHIVAVRQYDPSTNTVKGPSQAQFSSGQIPAAVVDWSGVAPSMTVRASWYQDATTEVAAVGPTPAHSMPSAFPLTTSGSVPSGTYLFIVGRYSGGRVVEVLARQAVQVV
ncbi:MAG: hypothetical protein WAM30_00660 [Candidatus Dormiibacterota bacterium]